ncbi:hypothetical protein DFH06DRAFT_1328646 [Mycena polygramma]|nr:hypothetical protein DFH06DRAFT_1328646 [Mycena polygramma]
MALFNNCADLQVHNGTFYAVHGDLNLHQRHAEVNTMQIGAGNEVVQPIISAMDSRRQSGLPRTRETWTLDETGINARDVDGNEALDPYASDLSQLRTPPPSSSIDCGINLMNHPRAVPTVSPPFPAQASGDLPEVSGTYFTTGNVNHFHHHADSGIHILNRSVAIEAIYDSAESFPQPRCHPETRAKMLQGLLRWATKANTNQPVLWLHGPAGAGKSAIMQTLCQRLDDAGLLGGSFFFRRGHPTRGNGRVLFATLAHQLALRTLTLKPLISKRVELNPTIVGKAIATQLRELIVEPCRSAVDSAPRILLIDGLDECDRAPVQQEILRSIGRIFCTQSLALKIILASRPEPEICEVFEESIFRGLYATTDIEQSFHDVRKYLQHEFARISREHKETMAAVRKPWPDPAVIEELVHKSSGYFVYPSTVIKYIDDRDFRPTERLEELRLPTPASDSPFAYLDQMYTQILSAVPVSRQRPKSRIFSIYVPGT